MVCLPRYCHFADGVSALKGLCTEKKRLYRKEIVSKDGRSVLQKRLPIPISVFQGAGMLVMSVESRAECTVVSFRNIEKDCVVRGMHLKGPDCFEKQVREVTDLRAQFIVHPG
jgi:hypothetical protein